MIEQLLTRWAALAPRERRLLSVAGVVLLVAVFWLGLFEPAWNGRQTLQRELPQLRAQVAQVAGLAGVARQAAEQARAVPAPEALRARVEGSLQAAGLAASVGQLEMSGERMTIKLQAVANSAWLAWLDGVLAETRMRVVDASVVREARPGFVSVKLVLEAARRDAR